MEESVSRSHAEILFHDDTFFIKDLGSSTGSYFRVKELLPIEIQMIIEMGSNQYSVKNI